MQNIMQYRYGGISFLSRERTLMAIVRALLNFQTSLRRYIFLFARRASRVNIDIGC